MPRPRPRWPCWKSSRRPRSFGARAIHARRHWRTPRSRNCVTRSARGGEAFNPTEGGSVVDGALPRPSTSLLFSVQAADNKLATEVEMAFWQGGRSRHVLRKWLFTGFGGRNITEHRIAFEIPVGESHST